MTSTAAPARRSDLGVRTISGIALILVALACLIYGQDPFWILLSAASLAMMAEWAGLIRAERWQGWLALAALTGVLLLKEPHLLLPDRYAFYALPCAALFVLAATRNLRLAAGVLYAGLPTLCLFSINGLYNGVGMTLWTLAIVWATDIGAYFAGRSIGGPKLAPVLSPNKTWAGLIGGMIAATLVGFLLAHVLHLSPKLPGFAGLLAVAAQMGDLFESAMKRRAGVKDSGRIIPGHGGAMDRLDGVVPVACLVALLIASGIL